MPSRLGPGTSESHRSHRAHQRVWNMVNVIMGSVLWEPPWKDPTQKPQKLLSVSSLRLLAFFIYHSKGEPDEERGLAMSEALFSRQEDPSLLTFCPHEWHLTSPWNQKHMDTHSHIQMSNIMQNACMPFDFRGGGGCMYPLRFCQDFFYYFGA